MRKKRASNSREVLVICGRAPFSICERYAWLRPRPSSFFMAATTSDWVMGRLKPRSEPSMMRRERSLSPRVMGKSLSSIAICKLYIAICNVSREIGSQDKAFIYIRLHWMRRFNGRRKQSHRTKTVRWKTVPRCARNDDRACALPRWGPRAGPLRRETQERHALDGGSYTSKTKSTVRSDCATTRRGVIRVCGGSGDRCRAAGTFCRDGCVRGRGRGPRWSCGNCGGGFRREGFRARRLRCVRRECLA